MSSRWSATGKEARNNEAVGWAGEKRIQEMNDEKEKTKEMVERQTSIPFHRSNTNQRNQLEG
jgi:hypothetical protein